MTQLKKQLAEYRAWLGTQIAEMNDQAVKPASERATKLATEAVYDISTRIASLLSTPLAAILTSPTDCFKEAVKTAAPKPEESTETVHEQWDAVIRQLMKSSLEMGMHPDQVVAFGRSFGIEPEVEEPPSAPEKAKLRRYTDVLKEHSATLSRFFRELPITAGNTAATLSSALFAADRLAVALGAHALVLEDIALYPQGIPNLDTPTLSFQQFADASVARAIALMPEANRFALTNLLQMCLDMNKAVDSMNDAIDGRLDLRICFDAETEGYTILIGRL